MKVTSLFALSALLAVALLAGCYAPVLCHCAHCNRANCNLAKTTADQKPVPK
jgi:hypothetical protein